MDVVALDGIWEGSRVVVVAVVVSHNIFVPSSSFVSVRQSALFIVLLLVVVGEVGTLNPKRVV